MGTKADHKNKADHNQEFLESIDEKKFPDWKVTTAFYRALHLVEMLLADSGRHSDNHRVRHDILKREFQDVWRGYHPLYGFSRRARYKGRATISNQLLAEAMTRLEKCETEIDKLIGKS